MNPFTRVVEAVDDRINPVAVKELRQAVQSRFVTGMLILLLLALLVAMTMIAGTGEISRMRGGGFGGGREAFEILFAVLLIGTMVFVPSYTGIRMAMERARTNLDLLFTTALKPGAVIRGKLLAGTVLTLLIFSVCLPFMSFTYLLRGVDLPSIFIILGMGFFAVVAMTQFTLMLACVSVNRTVTAILRIIALVVIIWSSVMLISIANDLLGTGIGSMLGSPGFWRDALSVMAVIVLATEFAHIMSVALISPPTANRAPAIRLYLSAVWLVSAGYIVIFGGRHPWRDFEEIVTALLCASLLVVVSERDRIGARVKNAIPKTRAGRIAVFPFFSGAAGGLTWTVSMAILMMAASFGLQIRVWPDLNFSNSMTMFGFFLYAYCYAISGLLIRKHALARWVKTKDTWGVVLSLFAAGHLIPLIVFGFFSDAFGLPDADQVLYGNAFDLLKANDARHFVFTGLWAFVLTLINYGWFARQIREFKPPETGGAP